MAAHDNDVDLNFNVVSVKHPIIVFKRMRNPNMNECNQISTINKKQNKMFKHLKVHI